jgi:flagellin
MRASAVGNVTTLAGAAYNMAGASPGGDVTLAFTGAATGSVVVAGGSTVQQAAEAINGANISGVSAFVNDGNQLQVVSSGVVTMAESGGGGNTLGIAGDTALEGAAAATSITAVSVDTVAGANFAIARVDAALTSVNALRGDLGAVQNRFESTIVNLQTAAENLEASRSRIRDADFAAETAALTKAQILQQAGTAVLAQANAIPQNVLSLLQ